MSDAEEFRWVSEQQEQYLENDGSSAWGRNWPEHLSRYLDTTRSGWQQEDDETRRTWLQERVESIALGWVTAEQRQELGTLTATRGDWRDWLPEQLDQWWPDWSKTSPAELTAWFATAMAGLLPRSEDAPGPVDQASADPRALDWLTADQRTRLESLSATRGDWHEWLPLQLDQWWPAWTQATTDQLSPWLDNALTNLTGTSAAASTATPTGSEADAVDSARTTLWARIPALASELGMSEDDLRTEFSKLTLDEIERALRGDLAVAD
ncbi:hypothetical protein [Kribbella sp. DT2]|uniref:hypothetical protein n=1 Tax=Kribbella sp. DT2 TaxID=3393427 RepID=UPI003CF2805A